ncbi:MAG: LamG-like jellyroll fold domain-containing protein [Bacillota bacterium]
MIKQKKILGISIGIMLVFLISIMSVNAEVNLTDGLITYYPFDENATDVHGSYDGSVTGATLTTGSGGIVGESYSFDGNDYIGIANNFGNIRSMNFWVKVTQWENDNRFVFYYYRDAWQRGFMRDRTDDVFFLFREIEGVDPLVSTSQSVLGLVNNEYNMITLVNESSGGMKIYVNGVNKINQSESGFMKNFQSSDDFKIGSKNDATDGFTGDIDEFGIWGDELNETEISALYNSGAGLSYDNFEVSEEEPENFQPDVNFTTSNLSEINTSLTIEWDIYDQEEGILNQTLVLSQDDGITEDLFRNVTDNRTSYNLDMDGYSAGYYNLSITLCDNNETDSKCGTDLITIDRVNNAPTISFTTANETSIYESDTIEWEFSDSENDLIDLSLEISNSTYSNYEFTNETDNRTSYLLNVSSLDEGDYNLTIYGSDNEYTQSDMIEIEVVENFIPIAGEITNPSEGENITNRSTSYDVTWNAFQDDFDDITYSVWLSNATDSELLATDITGQTYSLNLSDLTYSDDYSLTIEGTDGTYDVNSTSVGFIYSEYIPVVGSLDYGSCPTTTSQSLIFGFILLMVIVFIVTGLALRIPFLVLGSSIGLIMFSLYMSGCSESFGQITFMIGAICLVSSLVIKPYQRL